MERVRISRRGFYYDLTISPYEVESPCGEIFKFPSEKKMSMFTRDVKAELAKARKAFSRWEMEPTPEAIEAIYRSVYSRFEG